MKEVFPKSTPAHYSYQCPYWLIISTALTLHPIGVLREGHWHLDGCLSAVRVCCIVGVRSSQLRLKATQGVHQTAQEAAKAENSKGHEHEHTRKQIQAVPSPWITLWLASLLIVLSHISKHWQRPHCSWLSHLVQGNSDLPVSIVSSPLCWAHNLCHLVKPRHSQFPKASNLLSKPRSQTLSKMLKRLLNEKIRN